MDKIIFYFPDYEEVARKIAKKSNLAIGDVLVRHFPDGESLVQIKSDVRNKKVILVCGLDNPDYKIMALMFFADLARELGATEVGLIAPYLGYMRQDKRFHDGEAITSNIFAKFLSTQIDWLVTIDPHLHRHKNLDEIYSIPAKVMDASPLIANYIKNNIKLPLLIGPDQESRQWVEKIANLAGAPFVILTKTRHGDRDVEVSSPEIDKYLNHTPILVDDIISTARTMIETVKHLQKLQMKAPICIGVHGIFADNAYEELKNCGADNVITCNTIKHESNRIDVSEII